MFVFAAEKYGERKDVTEMNERLREESAGEMRCAQCGKKLTPGERYIKLEDELICASCADNLEIWQILEMLEYSGVIDIFGEKGKTETA